MGTGRQEGDHSPLSDAEVQKAWNSTSTSAYTFMACRGTISFSVSKNGYNFNFHRNKIINYYGHLSYVISVFTRACGHTVIYHLHYKTCLITVKYIKNLYIYQSSIIIIIIMLQFYFLEMSSAFCCVLFEVTLFCNLCYRYLAVYPLIAVYQLCNSFKVNTMYEDDKGHCLESDVQEYIYIYI